MSKEIIDGAYRFNYLPTQEKVRLLIENMRTPNICYCGGFGSGKSRLICELGLELGAIYENIKVGYFRKTRVSIVDTTYQIFHEEVIPEEFIKKNGHNKSKLKITLLNGSNFQFFGIDNFQRKGSLKFDIIFVDEGIELEANDLIMLEGRLRATAIPMPMIIIVTNAGMPGHIVHEKFVKNSKLPKKERDEDYQYFQANSFENVNNPKAYFDRLKKWEGTSYYARYVLSEWLAFEGVVLSNYNPDIHLINPFKIPKSWEKRIVIDFGYEHPCFVGWIARDPITNIDYLYRQFYHTRSLVKDVVKYIKDTSKDAGEDIIEIICDHDAENRAQVAKYWMTPIPARKSVALGIQKLIEAFLIRPSDNKSSFYIFNNAWNDKDNFWYGLVEEDLLLIEANEPLCFQDEVPYYTWGKDDKPKKGCDHAHDGVRYYINTMDYYGESGSMSGAVNVGAARR